MGYSVSQVAQIAGVTVRTLHHYDDIGLLRPSGRTGGGYRRYDDADLERLRLILVYRELGFTLEEIRTILAAADPATHLRRQHGLLVQRIERLREMVTAIEYLLEAQTMGISLSPEEKFEVFGDFDPDRYEPEARERWGDGDAYRESARRVAGYTKDDWLRIQRGWADLMRRFIEALEAGVPATSQPAMDLAEEHRALITEHFYECTYDIHVGLAEMYLADDRFRAHYDDQRPGLAQYVHDAIEANAVNRA
ncbi:MAG: MerR family transcriptional regulator [Micromonosporaceae bacterium]|nr:MerR family transcriptional regulator [Micromonosporaceae bacterium]